VGSRRKSSSINKKSRSEGNVLEGLSPAKLASLKRSADERKKSKSEGNVLGELSPMRLLHQRNLELSGHKKNRMPEIPDENSITNSAFDDAWNGDPDPPEHDIESLLQAVLRSKVLEPRVRQDSKKKAEIERLRRYLSEVSKLIESLETERTKRLAEEQENLFVKLQEQTEIIMEYRTQISYLEEECEVRKKQSEEMQEQLDQSHEHVEALLAEVEDLESHVLDTEKVKRGNNGEGLSLKELRDAKARVKELEHELHNAQTVPQLQIDELDAENKTLQGRLKAEKLDASAKLALKEETIEELKQKLEAYENAGDAQDLCAARQKLQEARDDANSVRKNLDKINKTMEEMKEEMDRLLTKNADLAESNQALKDTNKTLNVKLEELNKDILEWMDKAYNWKDKADIAARKVEEMGGGRDNDTASLSSGGFAAALANQSMFLQAAMEKTVSNDNKRKSWNPFGKKLAHVELGQSGKGDESANDILVRTLQDQKERLEDTVSLLQVENDTIEEEHKNEMAEMMVKLARLESENASLKAKYGVGGTSVSNEDGSSSN
jgi:predicted nuclease with TOPRIM domain